MLKNKIETNVKKKSILNNPKLLGLIFIIPATIIILIFIVYPVIDSIKLSFFEVNPLIKVYKFSGLSNYILIFKNPVFKRDLLNTIIWTVCSLAGQFILGLIVALAINQKIKGATTIRTILMIPYVVPIVVIAICWRWMLDGSFGIISYSLQDLNILESFQSPLGIADGAMLSVIIANIWRGFPFVMLIYWAALQSINEEQYKAAEVDGANSWHKFRYITLPNLKRATLSIIVLRGIWTITYFDLIWLITKGGPAGATEHWPIWIYQEALGYFNFGYAAALGTIMGVTLLLMAFIFSKIFKVGDDT